MVKFKVGDTIMISNVRGIMFAKDYFKDGAITEVVQVEEYPYGEPGQQSIDVLVPEDKVDSQTDFIDGKPTLYITGEELVYVIKLLKVNANPLQQIYVQAPEEEPQ